MRAMAGMWLMLVGGALGAIPATPTLTVDLATNAPQWDLRVKQGNVMRIPMVLRQEGAAWDATGYTVEFVYGANRDATGMVFLAGTVSTSTVTFTTTSNFFGRTCEKWYSTLLISSGTVVYSRPEGWVTVERAGETGAGALDYQKTLWGDAFTRFVGTFTNWPFWRTNQTVVTSETDPVAATHVWDTVQYPSALLTDGTRALAGNLDAGGYSITNVGTGTVSFTDGGHAVRSTEQAYTATVAQAVAAYGIATGTQARVALVEAYTSRADTAVQPAGLAATSSADRAYTDAATAGVWVVTQYPSAVLVDGSRPLTGNWRAGWKAITNLSQIGLSGDNSGNRDKWVFSTPSHPANTDGYLSFTNTVGTTGTWHFGNADVDIQGELLTAENMAAAKAAGAVAPTHTAQILALDRRANTTDEALLQLALMSKLDDIVRGSAYGQGRLWDFTDTNEYTAATNVYAGTSNAWWESRAAVSESYLHVGHWKLNDAAADTTVTDDSGSGNALVASRTTDGLATNGKVNTAFYLNGDGGTADSLELTTLDIGGSSAVFTVTMWFKSNDADGYYSLLGIFGTTGDDYGLHVGYGSSIGSGLRVFSPQSSWGTATTIPEADGTWHFVVLSRYTETNVCLYADGDFTTKQGDTVLSAGDLQYYSGTGFYLGGRMTQDPIWRYMGAVDDLRLFTNVLTAAQMSAIYASGRGTETTTPIQEGGAVDVTAKAWPWTYGYSVSNVLAWAAVTNATAPANLLLDATCDNGTNWLRLALATSNAPPVTAGGVPVYVWLGTGTCATAGTAVKIRMQTTNDAALRVYGAGVAIR